MIKMKFSVVVLSATIIFVMLMSSCQPNRVKISGRFIGGDSSIAYLEEISSTGGSIIDSVSLSSNGEFIFELTAKDKHHKLYNIVYDWSTIPLFAAAGDNIKLNSIGNIAKNYVVEGSEESELVRKFYQNYINGITKLDAIAVQYGEEDISEETRKALAMSYTEQYNSIKRDQLEFIIENKASLASVYALYQRLANDSYLFSGKNDVIYYRTVADALEERYSDSPYRKSIMADIEQFDAMNRISSSIVERGYPDLEMNDIYGTPQSLSQFDGKVIILDFWSARLGSSNRNNMELKAIYDEYKERGMEVYQVAIDNTKSIWINAIQEQSLPWTSVSDLKGNKSTAVTLYNITALPSNFVISKDGEIIARDIYGDNLRAIIEQELAK